MFRVFALVVWVPIVAFQAAAQSSRAPSSVTSGAPTAGQTTRRGAATPFSVTLEKLNSTSPADVRTAIEAIGVSGNRQAAKPLSERARRGLPPELLELALDTLTILARPEAGPFLLEAVEHRRPAVRLKAVGALAACRAPNAATALTKALADMNAPVRSAAALGLGQLRARSSIDSLFVAMERGVLEAAIAIGQIGNAQEVTRLTTYAGRIPISSLGPGFNEAFARRDIPKKAKLDIVAKLKENGSAEIKTYLQEFLSTLPPNADPALRSAIQAAIASTT